MNCDIVTQVSSSMSALDIILLQSSKGTVEIAASISRFSVLDHAPHLCSVTTGGNLNYSQLTFRQFSTVVGW